MAHWLRLNMGTMVLSALLVCLVLGIIRYLWKQKQEGKSSCGGHCGSCAMGCSCHVERKGRSE